MLALLHQCACCLSTATVIAGQLGGLAIYCAGRLEKVFCIFSWGSVHGR